jgi:hypothetical protein
MKLIFFVVGVLCLYALTSLPGFDSVIIKILGLALLALLVAANLRPSIAGIWAERRLPSLGELAVVLACFLICGISIWVIDAAKYFVKDALWVASGRGAPNSHATVDLIERLLALLVVMIALVPAARLILFAASRDKSSGLALWPSLISIFAALPILLGGWLLLNTTDNRGADPTALFLNVVLAFPPTLLLVAFGLALWRQAFRAAADARFTLAGVFPKLAAAGILIWLVTMVAAPAGLYFLPGPPDTGQIIGVCVMIGLGAAWLWLLRSVADFEAVGLATLSTSAFGLSVAFGISSLLARGLSESSRTTIGDAAMLILLFTLPVIGSVVAGIVFVVPRLLARLLRRPEAPANPATAR